MYDDLMLMLEKVQPWNWHWDKWVLLFLLVGLLWSAKNPTAAMTRHIVFSIGMTLGIFAMFMKGVIVRGPLGSAFKVDHNWFFYLVLGIHIAIGGWFLFYLAPRQFVTGFRLRRLPERARLTEDRNSHRSRGRWALVAATVGVVTTFVL